jgi:predicted GIY-YIG superfamily endonuclease
VLLRDRLQARLREMEPHPDYVRLAEDVLGIRNAPPALARRLVDQALVVEDRREAWTRFGERIVSAAPESAGVYLLKDAAGQSLYVGKAVNIKRRLRTHFAARRWKAIKSELSRVEDVVWREVGSELEALLLEAQWIRDLAPTVNVQRAAPSRSRPTPSRFVRDVLVLLPSIDPDAVELVAARTSGATWLQRTWRDGRHLANDVDRLWRFFEQGAAHEDGGLAEPALAPIVFSWLAVRGAKTTRLDIRELVSAQDLSARLSVALASRQLFSERLIVRNSRL